MKNRTRHICLLLLLLSLLLSFSGCSELKIEEPPQIRGNVEAFVEAMLASKEADAYAVVIQEIDPKEFRQDFMELCQLVSEVDIYELTTIGLHYSTHNGVTTVQVNYRMTTDAGNYVVQVVAPGDYAYLLSFYIIPEEQTTLVYTGTLGHMQGADLLQWLILLTSVLSWGFIAWMLVDCCRRKMQKKVLWILLILLGGMLLTWSAGGGSVSIRVNFGIYIQLNTLLRYGDGSTKLSLLIPLGAIIYCCMRRKLTEKAQPAPIIEVQEEAQPAAQQEELAAPAPEAPEMDANTIPEEEV